MNFDFHIGGIEDALLELLEEEMEPMGVKTFASYSGELDSDNLKRALGALTPQFPLVMVSYADGKDIQDPRTPKVLGKSLHFRHECAFAVICASNDARGESARRRGARVRNRKIGTYAMISKVREILGGLKLNAMIDGDIVDLAIDPLMPSGVEYIARIPNVTAYAVTFDTYFRFETADRSKPGRAVSEFTISLDAAEAAPRDGESLAGETGDGELVASESGVRRDGENIVESDQDPQDLTIANLEGDSEEPPTVEEAQLPGVGVKGE